MVQPSKFTQTSFLGASIVEFQDSLGWNGQKGNLSVTLVEDPAHGDVFFPPQPGSPVYFYFANYNKGGIFRDYVKTGEIPGGYTYKVNVTDPTEVLQNVQLIIDGYTGGVTVNNLFNIYGYLESFGFGNSQVNDSGMEYNILLPALNYLQQNPTQYGSYVSFVNNQYLLNLSQLPASLPGYRIQGPIVSLVDFISQVCADFGLDFFFRLDRNAQLQNVITVVVVSRNANPTSTNSIGTFASTTAGAVTRSAGLELRNEMTAKFLIGDNILSLNTVNTPFPTNYNTKGWGVSVSYSRDTDNQPYTFNGFDAGYPSVFTLNYRYGDDNTYSSGTYPLSWPPPKITEITGNDVWPYWGVDVYGKVYLQGKAQESLSYIKFLSQCYTNYDKVGNGNNLSKNFLSSNLYLKGAVCTNNGPRAGYGVGAQSYFLGKSVLSYLAWYHDEHYFPSPIAGYPYYITIGELRSALVSQDCWENYLTSKRSMILSIMGDQYAVPPPKMDPVLRYRMVNGNTKNGVQAFDGSQGSQEVYSTKSVIKYSNKPDPVVVYTRADAILASPTFDLGNISVIKSWYQGVAINPPSLKSANQRVILNARDRNQATNMLRASIYEKIHQLAQECYGKKFTVAASNVYVKLSDQLKPLYSDDPQSEGYFTGNSIFNLTDMDLLFFKNQENKIETFVQFDSVNFIDITKLNPDDFFIKDVSSNGTYTNRGDIFTAFVTGTFTEAARLYLRCSVEPDLVFGSYNLSLQSLGAATDSISYTDPRVVITLASPVYFRPDCALLAWRSANDGRRIFLYPNTGSVLVDALHVTSGQTEKDITSAPTAQLQSAVGGKTFNAESAAGVLIPCGIAYGLRSNVLNYGPWYAQGAPGKVEVEQDSNLNPWNCGGFTNMNTAANIRVNGAALNMQYSEMGSIEVPDAPSVQLGDALTVGGPIVSDITVNVGPGGVTTLYNMRSFIPQFGGMSRILYEKIRKLGQKNVLDPNTEKKLINRVFEQKVISAPQGPIRKQDIVMGTPHEMMVGATFVDSSGNLSSSVVSETLVELRPELGYNYTNIGGMSMDGLFRPYSTVPHTTLPSLTIPLNNSGQFPFPSGHDVDYIIAGTEIPSDLYTVNSGGDSGNNYRPIALKAPLMLCGFGQDLTGNYVPGTSSGYDSDYLTNTYKWKVGPVDLRWDGSKWVAPGSSGGTGSTSAVYRVTAAQLIQPYGSGLFNVVNWPSISPPNVNSSGQVLATSWLGQPICQGQRCYVLYELGNYYVNVSEYSSQSVITGLTCVSGVQNISRSIIYFPSAYASG